MADTAAGMMAEMNPRTSDTLHRRMRRKKKIMVIKAPAAITALESWIRLVIMASMTNLVGDQIKTGMGSMTHAIGLE